mgnify:FL=1|tara:strand:+ start:127 stop:582 length:456 start_codon:yes stop_codon:yes gene_type:complete
MKTFSLKQKEIKKNWFLINADGVILGRLAAHISKILRGKHKPTFTPHLDCGDNVIVINAEKIKLKGKKVKDKIYYRHTGYPGGIKQETPEEILSGKNPEKVVKLAVKRMLSDNKLARKQLLNLRVFSGETHDLEAQKPEVINFKEINRKNF